MYRTPSVVRSWSVAEIGRAQASRSAASIALLVALGSALPACGGKEPSGAPTTVVGTGPLLPFKTGNVWTYRITEGATVTEKTTTVGPLEAIGGTGPYAGEMAHKVVTRKGTDLADQTESWQAPSPESPDRVVRYREISYGATTKLPQLETHWDPSKLHIDGRDEVLVPDFTWREDYDETKIPLDGGAATTTTQGDRWTVLSLDESVTVAGKQYDHAVHFQKFTNTIKEYWYLRGVGKLKEIGTQTEELVSYSLK